MGSLVAGFATKGGAECYLIDPWQEHVDAINADGLTIFNNEDEPFTVACKAFTSPEQVGEKMDIIIVLVIFIFYPVFCIRISIIYWISIFITIFCYCCFISYNCS